MTLNERKSTDLLNQSCEQLDSRVQQQLNARRNLAMREKPGKPWWQYALVLSPLALLLVVWLHSPAEQKTYDDSIYADMELLIEAEQLDFLADMDVSQWIDDVSSTDS